MRYRAFYGLLYGFVLIAVVAAAAQDESTAERERNAIQSYLGLISQKLESHKRYPRVAERNGLSGRVVLRFTVRWDGAVIDSQITEVTGHNSFGDAALQALRQVGQLPPFPDEIRQRQLMVEMPIAYRIESRFSPGMAPGKDELIVQELLCRVEQGDGEALELPHKPADQGADRLQRLRAIARRELARREAFNALKLKAEQAEVEAQFELGVKFSAGEGVPQDNRSAVDWFLKAAEQGHIEAQFEVGARYAFGDAADPNNSGVLKDSHQAVHWLKKAAEQSYVTAQFMLGVLLTGSKRVTWLHAVEHPWRGVLEDDIPPDYIKAAQLLRLAAEQGHVDAQFELGGLYLMGVGVIQDDVQALAWFSLAAMQGDKAHYHRDEMQERMTSEEIAEAKDLARRLAANIHGVQ